MFARFVLPSLLIGIAAYATLVVFATLRFRLTISLHPHTGDPLHGVLSGVAKSPVAVAVGVTCALGAFAVLYIANSYYTSTPSNYMSR
jgi:hypothetical protein